jgi:hypothetical protein
MSVLAWTTRQDYQPANDLAAPGVAAALAGPAAHAGETHLEAARPARPAHPRGRGAWHLLYAATITVLRYLALALALGPFAAIGAFWAYLLISGPLVGHIEALDAGVDGMIPIMFAGCICLVIEFFLVLPTITSDTAREIGRRD